jgi:hypothetical protein
MTLSGSKVIVRGGWVLNKKGSQAYGRAAPQPRLLLGLNNYIPIGLGALVDGRRVGYAGRQIGGCQHLLGLSNRLIHGLVQMKYYYEFIWKTQRGAIVIKN